MAEVLIIDDDLQFCQAVAQRLQRDGHGVSLAHDMAEGRVRAESAAYDVVFLDVRLPGGSGLDLLPELRRGFSPPEVIIVTGYDSARAAELAIEHNAWDFIAKDSDFHSLTLAFSRALQYRESCAKNLEPVLFHAPELVGNSAALQAALTGAARAAGSGASVLVTGETGTGKELCAAAIHRNSQRAEGPMVVVDCAALPDSLIASALFGHERGAFTGAERRHDGLIRQADGGTLFLDEVAELPLDSQKALLRVLQERRFRPVGSGTKVESDFRVIAATNRDLSRRTEEGLFRQDLLYRLRGLTVKMPPLCGRKEDIPALCSYFAEEQCQVLNRGMPGFSADLMEHLTAYDWPGNVRELRQAITAAISAAGAGKILYAFHLPSHVRIQNIRSGLRDAPSANEESPHPADSFTAPGGGPGSLPPLRTVREQTEQAYLQALITQSGHDIETACRISGVSRPHVYKLLKKHGLTL